MEARNENLESSVTPGCVPPIEVVHAFGTCPDEDIQNRVCMLDSARVAYTVGSRVAIGDGDPGGSRKDARNGPSSSSSHPSLVFLSTGLRVARVTALVCSADKRFVSVCYKAVNEPLMAYATVYHMPTCPRPSRVKTVSYKRRESQLPFPPQQQQQQQQPLPEKDRHGKVALVADVAHRKQGGMVGEYSGRRHSTHPTAEAETSDAEFTAADFSHDGAHLALLDGAPAWTLLWFEWKTGKRLLTVEIRSPVYRVACSPADDSKIATAGACGMLRIWNVLGGSKVLPIAPPALGLRELCYRDVAWLSGDRLVAAAHKGVVTLMSPGGVLQEWDVREGPYLQGFLNAVAVHERGFFVGGMGGRLFLFESTSMKGTGGRRQDAYVLSRVVRLFDTDLVELGNGKGSDYRWLLVGERNGEIGLVDMHQLFRNPAAGGENNEEEASMTSSASTGGDRSSRQEGGGSRGRDAKLLTKNAEGDAVAPMAVRPGEAIFRGFANAMDIFENELNVAAAAEDVESNLSKGVPKEAKDGDSNPQAALGMKLSVQSGTASTRPLYRPVVRGLLRGRHTSLSDLSLCSGKPLLAVIARGVSTTPGVSSSCPNEPREVVGDCEDSGGQIEPERHTPNGRLQEPDAVGMIVEIQVWNYRTKRPLVKYRFQEVSSASGSGEGYAEGVSALPVAISFHPSGDSIAVAFPHFVNIFFIVGGCGEEFNRSGETADVASPSDVGGQAVAVEEPSPPATLRSDQHEILTRGMFTVAGEKDPIVNFHPVSAVHFSHGGHLLAVVTGKVVQILGLHAGTAGGRLGRVQTLSGHASNVSSFHWGADDRRCWTAAGGYLFEWEVGASLGCLEVDDARRGEFVGKRVTFEGIVSDPALDGGVAACAIGDAQETRAYSAFSVPIAKEAAYAGKAGKEAASVGVHVISGRSGGGTKERVAKPSDRAGEANATTAVATETKRGQDFATAAGADKTTKGLSSMKARVCASGYPRGTGAGTGEDADNLSSSSVETSSLFVWPGGLEPTAEVPGLRAQIPCRLTCVRITPFETRFGEARNALLAGTAAGMVVSFDWGCLVRDAGKMEGSVVKKGKGPYDAAGRQRDQKECSVLPSAQVCLHSCPVNSVVVTADGKHFFTTASDGAIFMCKIQLENRHLASLATLPSSTSKKNPPVYAPSNTLNTEMKDAREGMAGREIMALAVTGAGVSTAWEACVEEGMVLMEAETVMRLQAKASSARHQLEKLQSKATFESEKECRAHAQRLEAVKAAGRKESSRLEDEIEGLRQDLLEAERQREDLVRRSDNQRKREAWAIGAMYEKRLALQAESYIQLKVAYEELSQAARDDAEEMGAKAEAAERAHEDDKREAMQTVVEDNQILSRYVHFVGAQYHKALEDEQQQHDKQVNELRATEEVCQLEMAIIEEKAKEEVIRAKKDFKMISKRMKEGCSREVDTAIALATEKETSEQLGARVSLLEQEVRVKARRLKEWEAMAANLKTTVVKLDRLKKALNMQLVEQRSQLQEKEALITNMRDKLTRNAKIQKEGEGAIESMQKEMASKDSQLTGIRSEFDRLKISLRHREFLLKTTATRVMSALDTAKTKKFWLASKKQLEGIVLPLLERDDLDRIDADEAVAEQSRQRDRMQETIKKTREALRQEQQNNEQQNLVRVNENLELTRELNIARQTITVLEAKIARMELKIQKLREERKLISHRQYILTSSTTPLPPMTKRLQFDRRSRNRPSRAPLNVQSAPDFRNKSPLFSKSKRVDSTRSNSFRNLFNNSRRAEEAMITSLEYQEGQHAPKLTPLAGVGSDDVCPGVGDVATPPVGVHQATLSSSIPLLRNGTKLPRTIEGGHHDQNYDQGPRVENGNSSVSTPEGCSGSRRVACDSAKSMARHERARLSSDSVRSRTPSMGKRAGMKPGMMRVLLPGEGARDYASLLKGSETRRVKDLESRAATAEAQATRLAYENSRLVNESKRHVAIREAEAAKEIGTLRADVAKLRGAATPPNICTTPKGEDDRSFEAKKTDTRRENGDGFRSHIKGGSQGGEGAENSIDNAVLEGWTVDGAMSLTSPECWK